MYPSSSTVPRPVYMNSYIVYMYITSLIGCLTALVCSDFDIVVWWIQNSECKMDFFNENTEILILGDLGSFT